MEIQAIFFKSSKGNKYYTENNIFIPDGIVYTIKNDEERFLKTRNYIHKNRKDFGYNDMVMVLPANGKDVDIIGWPMMIQPDNNHESKSIAIDHDDPDEYLYYEY